ncbi:MAG: HlyD family efflux transporter periplasmic adaptor subunit [Candidatus Sulfopaludibacter sp.]|nr:HlyD family efflux transporter periplasmic adaptor subunit [Candidatus Sulfopaludibacter sp.]
MDIQRKNVGRKKVIRWTITIVLLVGVLVGGSVMLKQLKPAAPSVEMSTLWPDQVRRGPMVLDVRGLGTLVPEDTLLITATTDGRVERILIRPGADVRADSVVMIMSNPELQTQLVTAEYLMKGAEADFANLKVTLQKSLLDLQSQAAQLSSDYNNAKLQAERDATLGKDGLVSDIDAKISAQKAKGLGDQLELQKQRIAIDAQAQEAQLAASKVKVDQLKSEYELKKSQVDQLNVRAGFAGRLEAVPPPLNPVEEGQKVTAGTPLGKVAQPSHLKAELKIAETQVKDITIGLPAVIDTRLAGGGSNGMINGKVSRIDSSVLNGTVTVDVALQGALPPGSRPDLSVDGTIQLMKLDDVVYVGRPVFGQQDSTVQLFKIEPAGKYANKVKVIFGRSSVSTIEIKGGLNVGDRVILSDMSAYDNYDRIKLN